MDCRYSQKAEHYPSDSQGLDSAGLVSKIVVVRGINAEQAAGEPEKPMRRVNPEESCRPRTMVTVNGLIARWKRTTFGIYTSQGEDGRQERLIAGNLKKKVLLVAETGD
jgi:hypothetical protein